MAKKRTIEINGDEVIIIKQQTEDYISLTDMARYKNAESTGLVISHWLSTRYAVDFLGIWERINNPDFNVTEFSNIRMEAGTNGFVLTSGVKQYGKCECSFYSPRTISYGTSASAEPNCHYSNAFADR